MRQRLVSPHVDFAERRKRASGRCCARSGHRSGVGCGANPDDPQGGLGENPEIVAGALITGQGQCREDILTSTATIDTISNGSDTGISPTITAKFPLELQTLSGDATAFSAKITLTTGNTTSCSYTAQGPSRMTLVTSSCTSSSSASYTFSSATLVLTRLTQNGVGAVSLQATLNPADDQSRCSIDACDPTNGVTHANAPAGMSCSVNNNVCDGVEACDGAGHCNVGTNAVAGTSCSDGQPCNGYETCNGSGTCSPGTPPPAGTSCSDGNACNGEEYCASGACQPGVPLPSAAYDDGNPCTTDSCDASKGGIVNAPITGCVSNAGAPALDPTTSTPFAVSTQFLYSGSSPVQTGVSAGTIDPTRVSVIRGRVLDTDGTTAKVGAAVSVVGHAELGQTLTRTGGWYDIAVNGGDRYAVDITLTGYLRVQRETRPNVNSYFIVDDVVLTQPYTSTNKFVTGSATSSVVWGATTPAGADADASRTAMLYFPAATRPTNYSVADGTSLDVQLTEYTVRSGQKRMPGTLPGTSGYTYAVEASLPAATAAGVQDVQFDHRVSLYVNNFTGYPVGSNVPNGYYDRTKAAWSADQTGRIIKIITAPGGGQATIDIDGDGTAESTSTLDSFGIDANERTMLAAKYAAGTALWRCTVGHFSAWDENWGYGPPPDAAPPPDPNPSPDDPSDPCTRSGSVIGCESRTLGEALPIYGTPFSINYQSERAAGFRSRVRINVTGGGALPADLLKVYIDIEAAGRAFHYQRTPPFTLNDTFTWNWDGIDAYGRLLQHTVIDAHVRVSYEYNSISTLDSPSFGSGDGVTLSGSRNSTTWLVSKDATFELRRSDPKTLGFGGWTMSANHSLEGLKTIYFGDGTRRDLTETEQLPLNFSIDTVAGAGTSPNFNDGGQAVGAYLGPQVTDIAVAPDSTLYIGQDANGSNARVRKVTPAGIISTIGGLPPLVAATDGGAALHATVHPYRIAVATDGSVVFLDNTTNQIWKIDTAGILHLVAGNGLASAGNACDVGGGCGDG